MNTGAFMNVQEASDYLGLHPQTLRAWARARRLPGIQLTGKNGTWRFRRADLDAWIALAAARDRRGRS